LIRRYSLLIEGDENGYSAHVPELPAILVAGASVEELTHCAETAEQTASPTAMRKEIEVESPS
jgi:predicted RNase H-like HicB family nuclease